MGRGCVKSRWRMKKCWIIVRKIASLKGNCKKDDALKIIKLFPLLALLLAFCWPVQAQSQLNADLVYEAAIGTGDRAAALLAKGANPNAKDADGVFALSLAANRTDDEALGVVKALVESGAKLEVEDQSFETPLMNAIAVGNMDMVQYLLAKEADIYAVSRSGKTVLSQAEWAGNDEILALIQRTMEENAENARESVSQKRMNKLLDDFLYKNCTYQYMVFYKESGQDALDEAAYQQQIDDMLSTIQYSYGELQRFFNYEAQNLDKMAKTTQELIFNEMENLISNRNRRKHGIGADGDMERRCDAIMVKWHETLGRSS